MKTVKFQNVSRNSTPLLPGLNLVPQEKFQVRIQDLMKTNIADAEKHAQAIAEAVDKVKTEMAAAPNPTAAGELAKRHAGELKALEEKLATEHRTTLKTALDEALKSRPDASQDDQKGAIEAAVAGVEARAQARLQEEIASAVERGRMEQAAKNKLKDSQLVKAQKRVKELEAQIHEWQAAGIKLPQPSTSPVTPTTTMSAGPVASTQQPQASKATQLSGNQTAATPTSAGTQPKLAVATNAAGSTSAAPSLPRKPPLGPSALSTTRGGASLRGAGRGGMIGRGGAPLRQPPVKPAATAATSGGVSIIGAASKRPREDSSTSSDDSLAKRLKPADTS